MSVPSLGRPARRVGTGLLTLLLVTWVVFLLCHLVPGDAVSVDAHRAAVRDVAAGHRAG
jgi:ABC-type dipeptide/oligopeptide/nickel transport system permease component